MKRFLYSLFLFVCLFTSITTTKAQLCKGTPGAPIFKQTFGSGTGAGAALAAGTTTYTYTSGWPSDGQYTIANTSNPPPANTHWYTGTDHTGDPNGYMFVVNASAAPGEFFRYTVTGLCSNTTYVFSAWIANVNDTATVKFCQQNDPPYVYTNVLFKVENPVTKNIDSISTGNIPPGSTNIEWKQFGFTFSTGAGQTAVDLVMVNNSPGGCGNDLVIDDISFRPCGPTTSVVVIPSKQFYCSGDSLLVDATIGPGYNNPVYQWQFSSDGGVNWVDIPGANMQDLKLNPVKANHEGKYRLVLAESGNIGLSKCRVISDTVTIHAKQSPLINATATPPSICSGNISVLSATGASTYIWSTNGTADTAHVTPSTTSSYTVTGKDAVTGCISKATVKVTVNETPISPVVTRPDSICSGNTATLTATAPGGTYNWYETATGGTAVFTGATFITPILNNTKTYYVEVLATVGGCASNSRTAVTVIVNETPTSAVVAGPDSICSGNKATLKATAPGGTYKWYEVATGGTDIFTGPTYETPVLNSDKTYYVEVISTLGGCSSTSRTPVKIKVNETPVSPVVTGSDTICSFNKATLTAISPGGTYKWYETATGGTEIFTGAIYTTPVLTTTKIYYVEAVSIVGACASTSRTPVTVTVSQVKAAFTANPISGESPLKVDFTNLSIGGTSYHWDLEDKVESTSKDESHTYMVRGEGTAFYEVVLIVKNAFGCADTAKMIITAFPFSELIVPNVFTPNGDGINDLFTFESSGLGTVTTELFDRWGLKLYEWSSLHGGWDGRSETGLEVPEGTYYYMISAKGMSGKEYKLTGHFTLFR